MILVKVGEYLQHFGENNNKYNKKTWAIIKQRWDSSLGGMQYNVCDFGGHPILSAEHGRHVFLSSNHAPVRTISLPK
jgi:hypothetical protein